MTGPAAASIPTPVIPLGLRQALEAGDCVLFVGAGIGSHLFRDAAPAPDGRTLARELADNFKIDVGASLDLAKVSQIVEDCRDKKRGTHRTRDFSKEAFVQLAA